MRIHAILRSFVAAALLAVSGSLSIASAQGANTTQRIGEIKQALAQNQQALSHYTWQQQETVSVNGEVKKQTLYSVQIGPNGKPVRTAVSQGVSDSSGRKFGIKHRITENYEDYAKEVAALAQSYMQPNPGRLQSLYSQGNVVLKGGGLTGIVQFVIHDYVKPGDQVGLTFNRLRKAIVGLTVGTYLSSPSDVVTITAQFDQLSDGTNHVSSATINGQSKNLTITETNTNFQRTH